MSIATQYQQDTQTMNIEVHGRFDFKLVNEFKESYDQSEHDINNIVVDFRDTDYMDSSGLGMLLNLKRQMDDEVSITLANCKPQIKKILLISRFDKKFTIQ